MSQIIEWIKRSARSKLNYFRTLRSFLKWAHEEKYIPDDPMSGVSKNKLQEIVEKQDEKPPEIYTPREARLLLEAAIDSEIFPLLLIGFFCGLRTSELHALEWGHIRLDEDDPFVTVWSPSAKSRSLRNVELNNTALEWLSLCNKGEGIIFDKVPQTYDKHSTKIHNRAGVAKKQNGLRHSFGSYHYAMYGDEIRTAQQMGHNPNDHSLFR